MAPGTAYVDVKWLRGFIWEEIAPLIRHPGTAYVDVKWLREVYPGAYLRNLAPGTAFVDVKRLRAGRKRTHGPKWMPRTAYVDAKWLRVGMQGVDAAIQIDPERLASM